MSKKKQFAGTMEFLRRIAEVDEGPRIKARSVSPEALRASSLLALWVVRLENAERHKLPRAMVDDARDKVAIYRKMLRHHAA